MLFPNFDFVFISKEQSLIPVLAVLNITLELICHFCNEKGGILKLRPLALEDSSLRFPNSVLKTVWVLPSVG